MSHASLSTSAVEIILNCKGSTPLKIAFKAHEFWVERASSLSVKSVSSLGTVFPSALVLVGGFYPYRTNLHAFSIVDFMKARILTF